MIAAIPVSRRLIAIGLLAVVGLFPAASRQSADGFVGRDGTHFTLNGAPYYVAGTNTHYLPWGSRAEVDAALKDAAALHFSVVRTFIDPVIGSPSSDAMPTIWDWKSDADSSGLGVHGVYMLYWDAAANRMAFNDGPNGLARLDYVIAQAQAVHVKLLFALLDFWAYTGGAQQMRAWYGSTDQHTFFFDDPRTRQDYKDWVAHVLNHVNTITHVAYKDDPTIFAWDLMNEPYASPPEIAFAWYKDMATYVKSIDGHHLVASGSAGVDDKMWEMAIPAIDFGTWHGYPAYYNLSTDQFNATISQFCALGQKYNKPVLLEEFGYSNANADFLAVYRQWLDTLYANPKCAGWLVWRLTARQDNGAYPPDESDRFDIHNDGSALSKIVGDAAAHAPDKTFPAATLPATASATAIATKPTG